MTPGKLYHLKNLGGGGDAKNYEKNTEGTTGASNHTYANFMTRNGIHLRQGSSKIGRVCYKKINKTFQN